MSKFGHLGSKFLKTHVKFESSTFETGTCEILLRLESQYFLVQIAQIWAFGLKVQKLKASRKFQNSPILNFFLDRFAVLGDHFRWLWVVSAGFRSWLAGFGSLDLFWVLVSTQNNQKQGDLK